MKELWRVISIVFSIFWVIGMIVPFLLEHTGSEGSSTYTGSGTGGVETYYLTIGINPPQQPHLEFGDVIINPCQARFTAGTQVTLTAVPAFGFQFAQWAEEGIYGTVNYGANTSITITMDSDRHIIAFFSGISPSNCHCYSPYSGMYQTCEQAVAMCNDGTCSTGHEPRGNCSDNGGVKTWLR